MTDLVPVDRTLMDAVRVVAAEARVAPEALVQEMVRGMLRLAGREVEEKRTPLQESSGTAYPEHAPGSVVPTSIAPAPRYINPPQQRVLTAMGDGRIWHLDELAAHPHVRLTRRSLYDAMHNLEAHGLVAQTGRARYRAVDVGLEGVA